MDCTNAGSKQAGWARTPQAVTNRVSRHAVWTRAVAVAWALVSWGCAAPPVGEIREGAAVLFASIENSQSRELSELGGVSAQLLNDASDGRKVAVVTLPPHISWTLPPSSTSTMEMFVLEGGLSWGRHQVPTSGYVRLPAGKTAPSIQISEAGAQVLMFIDPATAGPDLDTLIKLDSPTQWRPGVVAKQDTGQGLSLEVRDLYFDPTSGQRTWLVRAGPDLTVPWEVHQAVEEGFLVSGDYYLGECLPQGPVYGEYRAGGYFYRPGGWVHSGPQSGSRTGVVWLMRTPSTLTVEFLDACPGP